jgi:hypothetical protein
MRVIATPGTMHCCGGRPAVVLLVTLLAVAACGGRSAPADRTPADASHDAAAAADAARDGARPDSGYPADAGTDPCACPTEVPYRPSYQFGECVPPLQMGCAATECTPGVTDCGAGYTCDEWGAAACCYCAQAVPACLFTGPAQGPLPDYLKINPTSGPAQKQQALTIEGFPFYVGALYYLARVGDSGDLYQGGGTTCSFHVEVPPRPIGMEPVWVSQYGGGDPWVLAGFFTFSTGEYPTCTQPGYPCSATTTCCETPDVPMGCVAGRCRRR